jgi:hypothetical protein
MAVLLIATLTNTPAIGAGSRTYEDAGGNYYDKHDYFSDHLVTPLGAGEQFRS